MELDVIRGIIEEQFPKFKVGEIGYLGEGFDSVAFVVNGNYVFRLPKEEDVAECLRIEMALLPQLRPMLSLNIPQFEFVGKRPDNQFPFVGYRMIEGPSLLEIDWPTLPAAEQQAITEAIGQFLQELHRFPLTAAQQCGVETRDFYADYAHVWQGTQKHLLPKLETAETERLRHIFEGYLNNPENFAYAPRLLHMDIWGDHVICDAETKEIKGIIDFGDVMIGDPDIELAFLYGELGRGFVEQVLDSMDILPTERLWDKLYLFWTSNFAEDALYGLHLQDDQIFEESFARLQEALGM